MTNINRVVTGEMDSLLSQESDWFDTYVHLSKEEKHHVLLESGRGGKYSIIGLTPWAIIRGKDKRLSIQSNGEVTNYDGPLLESLRTWYTSFTIKTNRELPDFQGGLIGQFSYDLIREIEVLPHKAKDDLETDDLFLMAFDEVIVIDHLQDCIWFIVISEGGEEAVQQRIEALKTRWHKAGKESNLLTSKYDYPESSKETLLLKDDIQRSIPIEEFKDAVEKTKNYISNGDVFQVNLSVRESRKLKTNPLHIYECLRRINPSPYMGYLHAPDLQYASASPELLVKVKGDEVSTRPIAGTRSRGKTEEEDQLLVDTLINNEKERAEHIMLVDLERNDLGRVCRYGSIEVDELMVIEKYSHVMHIVSNVKGKKVEGLDVFDVIAATFPGGTITGAPKIRTMEIIEELEPVRRGAYTGSLGWISFTGDMELNITIRTMVAKDGVGYVQAGAGIVIDSDPAAEYKESFKKAKALWKAKELSEEELTSKA
ncbi:anthranilate synthase component I family protein [Salipaludibacillus neizhouensis]|nr:anthranilate synthase component I family protein [Salipaludibacillus neizhouensis]